MKINIDLLKKYIELPSDLNLTRQLLDEVGLEVKDIDNNNFDIETLAHRGDHVSIVGVAREIGARNLTQFKFPNLDPELPTKKTTHDVFINTKNCFRYSLLEIIIPSDFKFIPEVKGLDLQGEEIVKLVNYVQKEIGQPLHAFDSDLVRGAITIDELTEEAEILALDENTYKVPAGSIVIKDREKIIAVAGVIGCKNSMVTSNTKRVVIESAAFDPVKVRITAKKMGLSTDASFIFERGSDISSTKTALERVNFLRDNLGSKLQVIGFQDISTNINDRKFEITHKLFEKHFGKKLETDLIIKRLKLLGYKIELSDKNYLITVPSWRYWNVLTEMTVVEDFIRINSYSSVKMQMPPLNLDEVDLDEESDLREKFENILLGNGFFEIITKAYYGSDKAIIMNKYLKADHVTLNNSLEKGYSNLRVSLIPHFAEVISNNIKYGINSIKIFEFGSTFFEKENNILGLAIAGSISNLDFREKNPQNILLFLQNIIFSLFGKLKIEINFNIANNSLFHPGRQIEVFASKKKIATFGEISPELVKDLNSNPFVFCEIYLDNLYSINSSKIDNFASDYPSIKRDLTIKIGITDLADKINRLIEKQAINNLVKISIVDDFKKELEDFRRLTLRLVFQSKVSTLQSSLVEEETSRLITFLTEEGYPQI